MSAASALAKLSGTTVPTTTSTPNTASPAAAPPGQSPGVEATPPAAELSKEQLESTKFAQLSKREQAIVNEREALKKEREALEGEKNKVKEELSQFEQFKILKSKDPVAALKKLGFSESDIINFMADAGEAPKEKTPAEIATEAAQAEIAKARKEDAEKAAKTQIEYEERVVSQFKGDLSTHLKTNTEKLPFCAHREAEAEAKAFETVNQVLKDTGEMISIEQAFQMAEDYYKEDFEALQKKRNPSPESPEEPVKEEPVKSSTAPARPKTLTNAATATVASTVSKKETREEKRARLERTLRGE